MATVVGTTQFDTYANYQLAYDLLSQNVAGNYSVVRLYGILNVQGYISWSSGSASVHTESQGIGTYYGAGSHIVIQRDFYWGHDANGNFSVWIGASINTTYKSGSTGGVITLPSIPRAATIDSFTGNDVDGTFKVTYTKKSDSFTHKLRISIPHVKALETYAYTSGTTFSLNDESKDYIYNYAKTNNLSTVPIGAVIETWSGGTKIGESSELINNCTLGAISKLYINGEYKRATPYVRSDGNWKRAIPYIRSNNEWKRSR